MYLQSADSQPTVLKSLSSVLKPLKPLKYSRSLLTFSQLVLASYINIKLTLVASNSGLSVET